MDGEILFPDIISSPCIMVSKEMANLIRMYCPNIKFKYMVLFDEDNKRAVSYQVPNLAEIDCLDEDSELSSNGNIVIRGILRGDKTEKLPIFRLKGAGGRYVMANLTFVESAYRREVRGMGIEEYVVR